MTARITDRRIAREEDLIDRVARAICTETCAFLGEPPCWKVGPGLSPDCDEPGCLALATAAAMVVFDDQDAAERQCDASDDRCRER
jgi:hypothetical protein